MTSYALETVAKIEAKQAAPKVFLQAVKGLKPGTTFTADSLAGVAQVDIPQQVGSFYNLPEFKRLAAPTGEYTRSHRTHGIVHVWVRTEAEAV